MESQMQRNLIKNPSGEEGFEHWTKEYNEGDGWAIETLPGDCGVEFPSDGVQKYFATSFGPCIKSQTIDLLAEGYSQEQLDNIQPQIVAEDWYAARTDAGCLYELRVQLQGVNHDVLAEFKTDPITSELLINSSWNEGEEGEEPEEPGEPVVNELAESNTKKPICIEQNSDGSWRKISHTFSGYGPGVRYVMFRHGGQDSLFWKGWYGVRVTNSSVTISS